MQPKPMSGLRVLELLRAQITSLID
ncbi:hypothetical protein EMIT0P74_50053 [Pseudomonas sp. IT-P74]